MRIAHVGVAGPFTENMSYQDNILSHQNALDGHEVLYLSLIHISEPTRH